MSVMEEDSPLLGPERSILESIKAHKKLSYNFWQGKTFLKNVINWYVQHFLNFSLGSTILREPVLDKWLPPP